MKTLSQSLPDRRDVVRTVLSDRGDTLVLSSLGNPTWDLAAAGDDDRNFYLWGAMGSATMMGLGLALAQPHRRVLVMCGDGELMMAFGSLATIGVERPANLAILVIDNGLYGETGGQLSHTGRICDPARVAEAAGFPVTATIADGMRLPEAVDMLYNAAGPVLVVCKVSEAEHPLVLPARDGAYLAQRFRQAVLSPE